MTQTLSPLYGDTITDTLLAKSAAHRPGLLIVPTVVADAARVTITPPASLGLWAWKTRWLADKGAFVITETAQFTVDHLSISSPNQVLVGRWEWIQGPLDITGKPTGEHTTAMNAVYGFEAVTAGELDDSVIETSIAQPDGNGRYGVVLGRLKYSNSAWGFTFAPATILDLAYLNTMAKTVPLSAWYKSPVSGGSVSTTRCNWSTATIHSVGNVPTVNGSGDLVVQETGFYQVALIYTNMGTSSQNTTSMAISVNGTIVDSVADTGMEEFERCLNIGIALTVGDVISVTYQSHVNSTANPCQFRMTITRP